eukprot:Nitzschia sp. Nitz4//scaffold46_size129759//47860//49056//NITZ4_003497-RA/size129759-processed-gene-0.222-mRNA-1//-1//CDS//3329552583//1576//frame0
MQLKSPFSLSLLFLSTLLCTSVHAKVCDTDQLLQDHPILCHMLDRHAEHPTELAQEINQWSKQRGLLVGDSLDPCMLASKSSVVPKHLVSEQLPVVFAHGMGDSCFNGGMQRIVNHTSQLLGGVYVTCIPTGDTQSEDTNNGYFLNMDASVDVLAAKIRQDPALQHGFHAIGFSQGNNLVRGYIGRYNDPPVQTFLSVNGVNAGEGAVPYCQPKQQQVASLRSQTSSQALSWSMCDMLMEQASHKAYTEWAQEKLFQANYWRDPRPVEKEKYEEFSQLARWNNEGHFNQTYKDNFGKTNHFVWILATDDEMVWPKEGEQWGAPDPSDPFHTIKPMNETEWYVKDLFGLKTAHEAGKFSFESFEGGHLAFEMEDFDRWVATYLAVSDKDVTATTRTMRQ